MRVKLPGVLMTLSFLLVTGMSAFAHHGFNVEFDGTKCMDMKGTLTGIDWDSPHAYLHMDVVDAVARPIHEAWKWSRPTL